MASLLLLAAAAAAAAAPQPPAILSCIFGLSRCIGVPDLGTAAQLGCVVDNVTQCGGAAQQVTPALMLNQLRGACLGQGLPRGVQELDATPVTFSLPVDVGSLRADMFQWTLGNGRNSTPYCVVPGGGPAGEPNERQTIAIIGDAGHSDGPGITALTIVGDLMLVQPDGSRVSAKGLQYRGSGLDFRNGLQLLDARLENFTTDGETLRNPIIGKHAFPNHCRQLFPGTTHRVRLLFSGGMTTDGALPLTPDRTDVIRLTDSSGKELPSAAVLGLADLGSSVPQTDCEKKTYVTDGDNYLDICLRLDEAAHRPAKVHTYCDAPRALSAPKGAAYPCRPQTVAISFAD
eukprot:TRINITY_DN7914_c0_g1_i1.p1 TRINITY_DN7914_c0_g1~~TRINITY_DN7914_c0_g1_i1.p1  ORF type:complete len:346 (+),score=73.44 TRINITY_DN7914_c0_g1_i1:65-1102(+)